MAKLQTQIKALKAYKSALISEAVLGQIPLKDRLWNNTKKKTLKPL